MKSNFLIMRPLKNTNFCRMSSLNSNFSQSEAIKSYPIATQCFHPVRNFAFYELEKKSTLLKSFIMILLVMVSLCSCMQNKAIQGIAIKNGPEDRFFARAEKEFYSKKYDQAFILYNDYLAIYPKTPLAPAALMKIGAIYSVGNNYENARRSYKRLINEYPDSLFVPECTLNILATYYDEGRFDDVIEQAGMISDDRLYGSYIVRKHTIIGDAYLAGELPPDAVFSYSKAYRSATEIERKELILKIETAAAFLSPTEIVALYERLDNDTLKGSLLYQQGLSKFNERKYDDAKKALSILLTKYPGHEKFYSAQNLIEEINFQSQYNRYSIGCLLPISGENGIYGRKAERGIMLAVNRFTSQESITPINVILKDTESNDEKAALAVQELADENVAAMIGLGTVETIATKAQGKGIPVISLSGKENINEIGDFVFRNFLTTEMQVKKIVSYATEKLGLKRFAVLYPDEKYGITFMNTFWDEVLSYGGEIVGVESYDAHGGGDFADQIKKLAGLYYEIPEDLKKAGEMNNAITVYIKETYNLHIDARIADSIRKQVGYEKSDDKKLEDENQIGEKLDDEFTDDIEIKGVDLISGLHRIIYLNQDEISIVFSESENEEGEDAEVDEEPEAIVDFDAVFIPDGPEKVGLILPQLAFHDVKDVTLLGTNLWHSNRLIEMARQHVQGAIIPEVFFAESSFEMVREFVKTFEYAFDEKPGFIEAVAYDTAMILFELISRSDIGYRNAIKDELINMNGFWGVTGYTSFDEKGDPQKELYLLKIKGKKFLELDLN